jgi:IMP dehydrogenase
MQSYQESKNCGVKGLTFDDILLLPGYVDFYREEVTLELQLHNLKLKLPVLSSPMDTVTESDMAISMAKMGGIGMIHRSMSVDDQLEQINLVKSHKDFDKELASTDVDGRLVCGAAVGVGPDFEERVRRLIEAKIDLIVIDTAHGFAKFILDSVRYIKSQTSLIPILAGNITTYEAANALIEAGADLLRVGMGPGSICTTRIVTGVGVPQLSAISEVKRAVDESGKDIKVIADGGIKQIGDIAKAIAFGADAVMIGSLLAGFEECPGDTIELDGRKFKFYRGMGSVKAMQKGGAARYGQASTPSSKLVAEGVEGMVKYKGPVEDFLYQISGGLKSSCYYIGGKTLQEFQSKVKYIKISPASFQESMPHSISLVSGGSSFLGRVSD